MKLRAFLIPAALLVATSAWADVAPPKPKPKPKKVVAAPSDDEALDDDILQVLDLPLAAQDARDAGVPEEDIKNALDGASEAGLSAGEAAEVVSEEAKVAKSDRGVKRGFGVWVRVQIAKGVRGQELADLIKQRKEDFEALPPEKQDEVKEELRELGERNRVRRRKLHAKRQELRKAGKKARIKWQEEHREYKQAARDRAKARHDRRRAGNEVAGAARTLRDAKTPEQKQDAREDLRDARKDHRDAKREHRDEKRDARDQRRDVRDAKKDLRDKRKEHRDAKKDLRDAKKAKHNKGK